MSRPGCAFSAATISRVDDADARVCGGWKGPREHDDVETRHGAMPALQHLRALAAAGTTVGAGPVTLTLWTARGLARVRCAVEAAPTCFFQPIEASLQRAYISDGTAVRYEISVGGGNRKKRSGGIRGRDGAPKICEAVDEIAQAEGEMIVQGGFTSRRRSAQDCPWIERPS